MIFCYIVINSNKNAYQGGCDEHTRSPERMKLLMKKNVQKICSLIMVLTLLAGMIPSALAASHPFKDVKAGSWYEEPVAYCYSNSLMNGTDSTTFDPDATMTRAMLATVLYRIDGEQSISGDIPFTDVPANTWYSKAIIWAYNNHIVKGISETSFDPQGKITREQIVTMFYRYAVYMNYNIDNIDDLSGYSDRAKISDYAVEAFQWAVGIGIISGTSATELSAKTSATRAQCAAIIQRFIFHAPVGTGHVYQDTEVENELEKYTLRTCEFCGYSTTANYSSAYDLKKGVCAYVNGSCIDNSIILDGVNYVSAEDFCLTQNGTVKSDGTVEFEYKGTTFSFSANNAYVTINGKATALTHPVLSYNKKAYFPLADMCGKLELSFYRDPEYGTAYCTAAAWERSIPSGRKVPVLMYHAVSNDLWGIPALFVKPEQMEQQLKYLTENGYDTIFFEDLYHVQDYDKPVILTFDDGYEDNYTELFPLLQKYNAKATVFVISGSVNTTHYLTQEQILEMADSGLVSIQSHTVTHPYLDRLSLEAQRQELVKSKLQIARLTHREPYVLAYPTGKYNNNTLKIIGDSYDFGIKMNGGLYSTGANPFKVSRYYISRSTTIANFKSIVKNAF